MIITTIRQRVATAVLVGALLVAGGLVGISKAAAQTRQPQPIQWAPCEGAPTTPARECAVIQVPLDYGTPSKGRTDLHIARVKASDPNPANHKGTLLVLPGGPPSAGVDYVGYTADLNRSVSPELQKVYNLVGIQQIGSWDGVQCMSGDPLKQYWETSHLPKNNAEVHTVADLEKTFNEGCASAQNPLVPYMNTARSIKDMETVRQALGVSKFNLLGFSYGTALAHGYMSQYPANVQRSVLDSVVDRSMPDPIHDKENNVAFDKSWSLYKDWCQASPECTLKGQNLDQLFNQAVATARTIGIPAPRNPFGNRPLNDWELTVGMEALTGAGEATRQWATTVLSDAVAGDGSQAEFLYDLLTGRRQDGSYFGGDGTRRSFTCNDSIWSQTFHTPEDVQAWAQFTQLIAPRYGSASVYQGVAQCYGWPLAPVSPAPHTENVPAGVGALLINADNDASTPLLWAKRVQKSIPGSRMVVVKGATHLQMSHSRCATNYAVQYLLNGTLPTDGAPCNYDADLNPPQLPPDLGPTALRSAETLRPEVLTQLKALSTSKTER